MSLLLKLFFLPSMQKQVCESYIESKSTGADCWNYYICCETKDVFVADDKF